MKTVERAYHYQLHHSKDSTYITYRIELHLTPVDQYKMAKYSYATAVLAYLTYSAPSGVLAFHPSSHVSHVTSISSSQLSAVPTPFIISPIIRKFREEQAKKNMPLATDEEKASEAPGLRIGKDAWKFPPIFPFDDKMFLSKVDEESAPKPTAQANPMAALLQQQIAPGTNAAPALPEASEPVEKFDYKGFWTSEMADVETALDSRAANALTNHYSFYIKSGMSVLEFGAAENSYLPEDIELERHVGVSLSPTLMEKNPRLTERLTVDLNDVTEEIGVNSDELYALGSDQFDAIIMANTVEFLSNPREVYKSAYRLLKPGGIMMVSFSSSDAYEQFAKAQNKWWRMFNSDQHTWVTGSFFRFSAGEGWANLKGFDASPEGAKGVTETSGPLDKILGKSDKPKNMYIVQARKDAIDDVIDVENAEKSFSTKLWLTPVMESRDKELVAARLGAIYKSNVSNERKQALSDNIDTLPKIYECLIKMDQFAFPFGLQAELAANLVSDPSFVANDEQILALRQGKPKIDCTS